MKYVFVALACLSGASCAKKDVRPSAALGAPASLTVFLSSDLKGYLGPCGCSENMRGGLARAASVVQAARVEAARTGGVAVFYFDAGNTIFGQGDLSAETVPQQERKARAMAEAFKVMGLSAKATGPLDDARGVEFRQSLQLPELPPGQAALFETGGYKLAVVSGPWSKGLAEATAKARSDGAQLVLLLLANDWATALKAVGDPDLDADLMLVARSGETASAEQNRLLRQKVPLMQLQDKGRSLLKLEFHPRAEGRFELLTAGTETERELVALEQRIELLRAQVNEPMLAKELFDLRKAKLEEIIARKEALAAQGATWPEGKNAFTARFIPLESSLPNHPQVEALVTAYDRDVGKMNVEWAKSHPPLCPNVPKGMPQYVGNAACKECHEDAFPVWERSKHVAAYATLEAKGKNFHLDCVGCHVVGFKKAGGVCRIDEVKDRDHVGCENCHGPGSIHAVETTEQTIAKGDDLYTCQNCHDKENSPHFNFKEYLAKIVGPGHGQPLPPKKK